MSKAFDEQALVELSVMGIALDTRTGTPIVVLNDLEKRRALPIWIGTAEASAIIRQLEAVESNRPMTHDLIQNMIEALGRKLSRVVIKDIEDDTYFAALYLVKQNAAETPEGEAEEDCVELDARPSDAVAIALRMNAPIYAAANVISNGTVSTDEERDEQETEAFKDFLKNIKASDFNFPGDVQSDQ